ncbi:O-acyltransferase [Operophtera brumata]|uniref:O-acyltransferase n=1 Tax=Operophtera brumata TaxID=104452 RepID=A0A0L7LFR9_OPEBR|nr:O-acyltransferase [Operophtera brumata]
MSEFFHKSCYTSRSSGYKYRTLSTNTGEHSRFRSCHEGKTMDMKFKELELEINSRVEKHVKHAQKAREITHDKLNKIDAKINSVLDFFNTVTILRQSLLTAASSLASMGEKVSKIEAVLNETETSGISSKKSSFRFPGPIFEEKEIF